jgi:hypothetical protein
MKPILILDAFITDDADEKLLNNFIDSSKSFGDDVLLMSNTKISKETQDKVNYFFYDKRNQLFTEEYNNHKLVSYYTIHESFKVSNIFSHSQPHGLSVLINIFRAVKIAKDLGFIIDANVGVEYRYTNRISAFLQCNNVAAQQYFRWYKYPVQAFQIMGGVTFRF